jgi:hypothetical protein
MTPPLEFYHVTLPPLVTLEVAKLELRITDTDHDADVDLRRRQATNIVLDYLQHGADPTWTDTTVPDPVQQAILVVLSHLYERGQTMRPEAAGIASDADVWAAVAALLRHFRDPGMV